MEPWDRWAYDGPRYAAAACRVRPGRKASLKGLVDEVHCPLLPQTFLMRQAAQRSASAAATPAVPMEQRYKTKEELRAERQARLKEKQKQKQRDARKKELALEASGDAAATGAEGGSLTLGPKAAPHDRLSTRHLTLNLFQSSVLNPLGTESKVLDQYEQRFLEHQRRNHDRHVAALPQQILKRQADKKRHATAQPVLRAYRIYPLYSAAHLGKLRNYANDQLLRGCVLWVAKCDAVVLLAGGEVAARHLDRWMLQKMQWEHAETAATRLCSIPLSDCTDFSFHIKKDEDGSGGGGVGQKRGREEPQQEAVFMNMVDTVEEGETFLRRLPAAGSAWRDFAAVWRAAFLEDGLKNAV